MTLVTRRGLIDVMDRVAGVGEFAQVFAESEEVQGSGMRFRVLTLPALIRAKRAAGRKKDRDQLPELEALFELTKKRKRS
jgi:predicted nucleotidyltransferase